MLRIETGLMLLALALALGRPALFAVGGEKIESGLARLSRRRVLSIMLIASSAIALRLILLPVLPIPEPVVHDEFGYLLAADTFAHGRLTNPTHPLWQHFESFSILQKPTYQCFGQPGQGMILALGKLLFGHPFGGVLLSVAAMCGAITWMLQGWLGPEWALIGGILCIARYGSFCYWANSYWGGSLGAAAGALVLGALPRIQSAWRTRDATLMGAGMALLVITRPYEGLVFSLPIAAALVTAIRARTRPPLRVWLRRTVLPLGLVLGVAVGCQSYYFWRVTGNPFRSPYQVERETYAVVPYMAWQHFRPAPAYHNEVMKKMYSEDDPAHYRRFRSFLGQTAYAIVGWSFFLGPALTAPFLMLFLSLPNDFSVRNICRPTRFLLIVGFVFLLGCALENYYNPHYSSPATGLILALTLLAMRQMRRWSPRGVFLSRALPIICLVTLAVRAAAVPLNIPLHEFYEFAWHETGVPSFGRQKIQEQLERMPGKHLVMVHYGSNHDPFFEWVYNEANIDNAKVVWSRELGSEQDRALMAYFHDRKVWLLEADRNPPKLRLVLPQTKQSADIFASKPAMRSKFRNSAEGE
ncbi:MAG: hypothetical protein JO356_18895 [Acidobacteria bacterium]|nr:hypothetical protein [Acidobacteriota bacterium]